MTAALLLADGRFPSGGHAHSAGYEPASKTLGLATVADVADYVRAKVATTGVTEVAMLAATMARVRDAEPTPWDELDAEVEARIVAPALRRTSRALGRQWLRAGRRVWPDHRLSELAAVAPSTGPHQVVAFAVVATAADLDVVGAANVHLHHLVSGLGSAAVRLHGLDPFEIQRLQADMAVETAAVAARAEAWCRRPLGDLPAPTGPLLDVLAEDHARWSSRLFQS